MLTTAEIRNLYEKIQKMLFYMIPEKWDRVYLYASVLDHYNNVQTGEMFFYYYPKSILKKNPVNVYEIPNKFNLDEQAYLKLAEKLYDEIKLLRTYLVKVGEKPWTNITIWIKDFKFNIEYNYEDLVNSNYTSYDRHLIWRYKYLDIPLSSYSKKDRQMVERYLSEEEYHNKNISTYNEGIYQKQVGKLTFGKIEEPRAKNEENTYVGVDEGIDPKDMKADTNCEKTKEGVGASSISAQDTEIKSQILKFK